MFENKQALFVKKGNFAKTAETAAENGGNKPEGTDPRKN